MKLLVFTLHLVLQAQSQAQFLFQPFYNQPHPVASPSPYPYPYPSPSPTHKKKPPPPSGPPPSLQRLLSQPLSSQDQTPSSNLLNSALPIPPLSPQISSSLSRNLDRNNQSPTLKCTKTCNPGEKLTNMCTCAPCRRNCSAKGAFLTPDCTCSKDPCDACPSGTTCEQVAVNRGNTRNTHAICRRCECGFCDKFGLPCCTAGRNRCRASMYAKRGKCRERDFRFVNVVNNRRSVCGVRRMNRVLLPRVGARLVQLCGCEPKADKVCIVRAPRRKRNICAIPSRR